MARYSRSDQTPVVVASRTYRKCARILADECDIEVVERSSPSETFLATVAACRGTIEGDTGRLTPDDFSKNDLLEAMSLCLEEVADDNSVFEITRYEFLKHVHNFLIKEWGLRKQIFRGGDTGDCGMLKDLLHTFIKRTNKTKSGFLIEALGGARLDSRMKVRRKTTKKGR